MEEAGPLKRLYSTTTLHGVTTQKTMSSIITAVGTSNLPFLYQSHTVRMDLIWVT